MASWIWDLLEDRRLVPKRSGSRVEEYTILGFGTACTYACVGVLRSESAVLCGMRRLLNLAPADKRAMERRVEQAFASIVAEDRISQLVELYRATIDLFASERHQSKSGMAGI